MRRRFRKLRRFVPELLVLFAVATTPRIGIVVHSHPGGEHRHVHVGAAVPDDRRPVSRAPQADRRAGTTLAALDPADHVHWQQPFAVAAFLAPLRLSGPEVLHAATPGHPAPCPERRAVFAAARAPPAGSSSVDR